MSRRGRHVSRALDAIAIRPTRAAVVVGVVLVLLIAGIGRLGIAADLSVLSSGTRSAAGTLADIEKTFLATDELIVIIEANDGDEQREAEGVADRLIGLVGGDGALAAMGVAWRDPAADSDAARRVLEEVTGPSLALMLDRPGRDALARRLSPEGIRAQLSRSESALASPGPVGSALGSRLAEDPLQVFDFVLSLPALRAAAPAHADEPGAPAGVLLRFSGSRPASDAPYAQAVVDRVHEFIERAAPGALRVRTTGAYAIAAFGYSVIWKDMILGTLVSIVLVGIVYIALYSRLAAGLVAALPVAGAICAPFGLLAWTRGHVSHLGTLAAAVLAGLAIDYSIHSLSRWAHTDPGKNSRANLLRQSRHVRLPMTLSAITSAIAFGAMLAAPVPALRDFAALGVVGIAAALALSLTLLPAIWSRRPALAGKARFGLGSILALVARSPRTSASIVLAMALLACLPALVKPDTRWFDHSATSMHPSPNPALEAQETLATRFNMPPEQALVLVEADDDTTLLQRVYSVTRALTTPAAEQLGVRSVRSIADILPEPSRDRPDDALARLDPREVEQAINTALEESSFDPAHYTQYAGRIAAMAGWSAGPSAAVLRGRSPFDGLLVAWRSDKGPAALVVVELATPLIEAAQRERVILTLRELIAPVPAARLGAFAGIAVDLEREARRDLPLLVAIVSVGVFILLSVSLRNPAHALLAMLPAALAVAVTACVMAAFGPGWNVISAAALALVLGLGVDDGVFLTSAIRGARSRESLIAALAPTGHAILATTLTTSAAFGSLVLSSTPAVQALGWTVALGSFASLIVTIGVQFPLRMWMVSRISTSEREG